MDKGDDLADNLKNEKIEVLNAGGDSSMAITFLKLKVSNPARPKKSKEYEFLVDSGAIYSVIPREELKRLGIKPTSYEEFTLANGEIIRSPVGNAYFEYKGKIRAAPVIFGKKGIFLLGATTLEALGMMLDPIRRELKPLPMVLMSVGKKPMQGTSYCLLQALRSRREFFHQRINRGSSPGMSGSEPGISGSPAFIF